MRACIYAGVAGTYAQLQQEQEAYRFLGLAYEHFPEKPESDRAYFYANGGYFTLIFCDALIHLDFHHPDEAEKIFARIDGQQPTITISEKARVELLNYQAETSTTLKNMEQACTYLETAAKASIAIGSERRLRESFAVFQQMSRLWPAEQKIRNLGDLFALYLIDQAQ